MKLWGYIQLDPGYWIGYFSTSSRNFITGKLTIFGEPEVKNMFKEKKVQFCSVSTILLYRYLNQGRRRRLLKNCASYVRVLVYTHTRKKWFLWLPGLKNNKTKIVQKSTSSNEIASTSGSNVFYFRFTKNSQFRVKLYIPSKCHANRSIRLGGDSLSHIKCNSSKVDSPWSLNRTNND